jgi:mono/diheme cytochrome c family protein
MPTRNTTTQWRTVALVIVAAFLIAACNNTSSPTTEAGDTGIAPQDPELVEVGAELYQANCADCHGTDLRGTDQGPSHLSIVYEPNHHGDGAFLLAIQRGTPAHHWPYGNMEPVEGLTNNDITAIIAYVREQQRLHGFEPYPPP